jgi:hypothetical protein
MHATIVCLSLWNKTVLPACAHAFQHGQDHDNILMMLCHLWPAVAVCAADLNQEGVPGWTQFRGSNGSNRSATPQSPLAGH